MRILIGWRCCCWCWKIRVLNHILNEAKYPVLLLSKLKNVVDAGKNQGLALTGPNWGGNTIILKLMGLCILMCRYCIPIPLQSKVAEFVFFNPILADIGDLQSMDVDFSTISDKKVCFFIVKSLPTLKKMLLSSWVNTVWVPRMSSIINI